MKKLEEMSYNEKQVRRLIVGFRNDYVGGLENAYLDNGEEEFLNTYGVIKVKDIEDYIYDELINGNEKIVYHPTDGWGVEKKHIKFLGKDFIEELIHNRVMYDYNKNGWEFPNELDK